MQLITIENNLAMVLKDLGKYEESKIIMKKIIESNEKNYGSEHPITSISYSNLATVLQDTVNMMKQSINGQSVNQ